MEEPSKQQNEQRHGIAGELESIDSIDQRGKMRKQMITDPFFKHKQRYNTDSGLGSIDSSGQWGKTKTTRINNTYHISNEKYKFIFSTQTISCLKED